MPLLQSLNKEQKNVNFNQKLMRICTKQLHAFCSISHFKLPMISDDKRKLKKKLK